MRVSQKATGVWMLREDNGVILECSAGSGGPIWLDQADDATDDIRRFTQWMMQERSKVSRGNASRVGRRGRKVEKSKENREKEKKKGKDLGRIVVVVDIVDGVGVDDWNWNWNGIECRQTVQ